jgi:hypothetical protein
MNEGSASCGAVMGGCVTAVSQAGEISGLALAGVLSNESLYFGDHRYGGC